MKKLLILGAGGYGKTIADVAGQLDVYEKIAFLDDGRTGAEILGRCDEYAMFAGENTDVYPAFGNNEVRMEWLERLIQEDIPVPTLIHPSAYVSPSASVLSGTVILPKAVVNTDVTVEAGCIVNIGALIDHDCILGAGTHVGPGAVIKAENKIPAGSKIEAGEVILNRTYPL